MVAELIAGSLQLQPRPAKAHAAAASALGEELGPPFKRGRGGPGGWILLDEPEIHLAEDVVVPDMAGWRRTRMPEIVLDVPFFTLAPDWVAEVESPSTRKYDRTDKLDIYWRERVEWVWFIDPLARTLEVLLRVERGWNLRGSWRDDTKLHAEPFDAIEFDLSTLWADVVPIEGR